MRFQDPYRIALHEAGHAAMHIFLRLDNLDSVSIAPKPELNSAGRCVIRYSAPLYQPRIWMRKRLFVLKAGAEGELLYPGSRRPGDDSDVFEHVRPILNELFDKLTAPDALYRYYHCAIGSRVRRLVRGKLREPIKTFAKMLVEKTTIGRYEAHDCLVELLGIDPDNYWRLKAHIPPDH